HLRPRATLLLPVAHPTAARARHHLCLRALRQTVAHACDRQHSAARLGLQSTRRLSRLDRYGAPALLALPLVGAAHTTTARDVVNLFVSSKLQVQSSRL